MAKATTAKSTGSRMKKWVAGCLTAMMCISLTSCADTSWAAKYEDTTIPAGVYIMNQMTALNEARSHEDYDSELEDIWDNKIEDQSMEDWINDRAKELTEEYVQVRKQFGESGLTLSEEDLDAIDYSVESVWSSASDQYEDVGVSESSYEAMLIKTYEQQALFDAKYGEGGTDEVGDEDLMAYYKENYAQVQILSFSTYDSEAGAAMDDTAKAEVKKTADEYLERAKAGESMVTLINDKKVQDAKDAGQEEPEIDESADYMQTIQKSTSSYSVSDTLRDAIFADAKVGEPILLSDDNAYYLVLRHDVEEDAEGFEDAKSSLLYAMKSEEFNDSIAEQAEELEITWNDDALKKFKPEKLVKG